MAVPGVPEAVDYPALLNPPKYRPARCPGPRRKGAGGDEEPETPRHVLPGGPGRAPLGPGASGPRTHQVLASGGTQYWLPARAKYSARPRGGGPGAGRGGENPARPGRHCWVLGPASARRGGGGPRM